MLIDAIIVLGLLPSAAPSGQLPILEFPEPGVDDVAAYEGYATRFFRDSRGNAFQVYIDSANARVVHVWADAANASAAFTIRDNSGRAAPVRWGTAGADADSHGRRRVMKHGLESDADALEIGWFVLGSMRQERDFQYAGWHRRSYGEGPFVLAELQELTDRLKQLPAVERERHLSLLLADSADVLEARLEPRLELRDDGERWAFVAAYVSLDGRRHMTVELRGDASESSAELRNDVLSLRAHGDGIRFDVTLETDEDSLKPLGHDRIFNADFERFFERQQVKAQQAADGRAPGQSPAESIAFRRLERAVLGLELLSYEEKLMAALPNYATYFGRDMMMAALMLESITGASLQEHVIGNVLAKVSPSGDVSHEEALGGQAIRENAAAYSAELRAWEEARRRDRSAAAAHLARARERLANLGRIPENYHMIDDDFQLLVLLDRYLARADVPVQRKREFLGGSGANGARRLDALVRNLALVAELTRAYAEEPAATNLVGFRHRDAQGWQPGSWRDSRAGYGNGRFAMDVNAVWVPKALEALNRTLTTLEMLGLSVEAILDNERVDASALRRYLRNRDALSAAIRTWRGSREHFRVILQPGDVLHRVRASLASLPEVEESYWRHRLEAEAMVFEPLEFLALSLDEAGAPIPAASTDPATELFLGDHTERILRTSAEPREVLSLLDPFVQPYPTGLLVKGVGPIVVNDLYASAQVQRRFREDDYHSPRVVWGREVNLLLLGLARQIEAAYDAAGTLRGDGERFRSYVDALRRALDIVLQAVEESGMQHNELWTYQVKGGTIKPLRYGSSSDIQLWNLTDLAVRYHLDRLPAASSAGGHDH